MTAALDRSASRATDAGVVSTATCDEEYDRHPRPEMNPAELWEFHHRAATIAFRARAFFPDASMSCSRSAKPLAKPGTLAGLMQSGRMP